MKKIHNSLKDLRTTIPGILLIAASLTGFFLKYCDLTAMVTGVTAGAALMGINTKKKSEE